jgi:hypothetical protein
LSEVVGLERCLKFDVFVAQSGLFGFIIHWLHHPIRGDKMIFKGLNFLEVEDSLQFIFFVVVVILSG